MVEDSMLAGRFRSTVLHYLAGRPPYAGLLIQRVAVTAGLAIGCWIWGAGMSVDVQHEWMVGTLASDTVQLDRRAWRHDDAIVWVSAIILLIVLAVALLWYPLSRAMAPGSITYNEGWNVYWQQTAAVGHFPGWLCSLGGCLTLPWFVASGRCAGAGLRPPWL